MVSGRYDPSQLAAECDDNGVSTYPVDGGFGNVFTDLLGRKTERSDLGRQRGLRSDLTTCHTQMAI